MYNTPMQFVIVKYDKTNKRTEIAYKSEDSKAAETVFNNLKEHYVMLERQSAIKDMPEIGLALCVVNESWSF